MQLIRTTRDLRVDFFRGMALWWIFVDHIGANWLNRISLHNFALCDATEVFVLLAGYAAGIAYGRTMTKQGYFYAAADVLRRAWVLYVAHIFLFVVFTAQVAYSAAALDRADYLDEIHLNIVGDIPFRALFEALTLGFQPSYLNILPLYIALLLLFVPGLALLRKPPLLAFCSFALYAASRLLGWDLPSWTGEGWYFDPLTWQFLFMAGAILSYAPGEPIPYKRTLDILAIIVIAFGAIEKWFIFTRPELTANLPVPLTQAFISIDKEGLHPMRMISILAFAWLVSRWIPQNAQWLQWPGIKAFVLCGQRSLPVFCGSIFLSFLGRLAFERHDGWTTQVLVNVIGAGALIVVAVISAWYDAKGRAAKSTKIAAVAAVGIMLAVGTPINIASAATPLPKQLPAIVQPTPVAPAAIPVVCPDTPSLPDDGDVLNNVAAALKSNHLSILTLGSGGLSMQPMGKGSSLRDLFLQHLASAKPELKVDLFMVGSRGATAANLLGRLPGELARHFPKLVIWQTGTSDAIQGVPPDEFNNTLLRGAALVQASGADLILIDPPYSRYLDSSADLSDYEPAFHDIAALPGVVLFRRNDIMHDWAKSGALDLESDPAKRPALKAKLHECLTRLLLKQILDDADLPSTAHGDISSSQK